MLKNEFITKNNRILEEKIKKFEKTELVKQKEKVEYNKRLRIMKEREENEKHQHIVKNF